MNKELKDWQIAKEMFGLNTKAECKIVSDLRKAYVHVIIIPLCEGWSNIIDKRKQDDCGYLIPNECI